MAQNMKETMSWEKSMVKEPLCGQMARNILENFTTITSMVEESTLGVMVESMKVNGEATKCMEKAYIHGKTEDDMMDFMIWIENTVKESISGQMVAYTLAVGNKENKMDKVF